MVSISFGQVGSFNGATGGSSTLTNPTSLQFGPGGKLYVAEQNGTINVFTVELENGQYIATSQEELRLPNGSEVVRSIQNHNDDGAINNDETNRQVTGLVVTGTAANPVLYVSSSDPRIGQNGELNIDTNSGVVTQVTWAGAEWEAVDMVRGLPRSEENHSVNGLDLSADGSKLYLATGGNTNNGAPSQFFSYTGEYALSGTILEIDLEDINSRPVLTDSAGGQNGTSRQYVYDLPTLDNPTVANITDGIGEDEFGLDEAGPWGGHDGFNMAILPADAPLRIYADGFRNHYDVVVSEAGQIYTVDNGSNDFLGDNPIVVDGEASNLPNDGGIGDPEPLFLVEDGGYYGHPSPARANQDLAWTVYDDNGNPDPSITPNSVPDLSALVPVGIDIADGFLVDPSKFTDDPDRLAASGVRIERDSPDSNALTTLGSSSNGLVEYTSNAFNGALQGALIVTQFNGNVTLLNLNDEGTGLEPLVDPGDDGILGSADDEVIDEDGIFPLISGQATPLDVTVGPDGTLWVAELGDDTVSVFAPGALPTVGLDFDNDGINNIDDPFIRDATNGSSVVVAPGETLLWDFDPNQDSNLPGPSGYGGGLTGVMLDGSTDYEAFFQEPSDLPGQLVKLDNVKFTTAGGGGTTIVENVSNGDPFLGENDGEYLFHTGVTIAPTVDTFNVKWSIFNPASSLTGPFQQVGGYIGTGDQNNYLKIVAIQSPEGEIQVLLENNDEIVSASAIQADDLFDVPDNQQIFFELVIDPSAATATPIVTYETGNGNTSVVSGSALDLSGTNVLDAILGNYTVQGETTGLAVGLFATNTLQPEDDAFQAIFNDIEITATGDAGGGDGAAPLYRVNVGGEAVGAPDGQLIWSADTNANPSPFRVGDGGAFRFAVPNAVDVSDPNLPAGAAVESLFQTERFDPADEPTLQWEFAVDPGSEVEVRLYFAETFNGITEAGQRSFDVAVEGTVPTAFNDIDPFAIAGSDTAFVLSTTTTVTDGSLSLEFLNDVENPAIKAIEILTVEDNGGGDLPTVAIAATTLNEADGTATFEVSLSAASDTAITVDFATIDGTATADSDYLSETGTLTFAAGETTQTITVDIVDDTTVEPDETFTVELADASGAVITDGTGTATILNDDVDPPESADLLFVLTDNEELDGTSFSERDIIQFDGDNFSQFFDGSDVGLTSNDVEIDAFDVISENEILLSFNQSVTLSASGGLVSGGDDDDDDGAGDDDDDDGGNSSVFTADDSDIVKFTASSLGSETAGSFSLYFDGSDVGLSSNSEDIDALMSLPDGSLLLSTVGSVNASGVSRQDEDILLFTPNSLGSNTAGSLSVFVDGSDVGLGNEDVDGLAINTAGDLLFSVVNNFAVEGLSGADEDIFTFQPVTTGPVTTGSFESELAFNGSQFGLASNDIKGIDVTFGGTGNNPGGNPIRLEAEAADSITGFSLETVDAASGGQTLSFLNSSSGSGNATFGFDKTPGTYDIILGTFDETDGVAQFNAALNDVETGTTTEIGHLVLDANLGSALPDTQTSIGLAIASGIALTPGDSITVTGFEDGTEFARLDYIDLVPVNI